MAIEDILRELRGAGDTAATIGVSALKQPFAGYAGLIDLLRGKDLSTAVDRIERVGAVKPKTKEGERNLQAIGEGVEWVGDKLGNPIDKLGEFSPVLGAGAAALVETADPTRVAGKAAKAAKAAKRATEKAKASSLRADIGDAVDEVDAPSKVNVGKRFAGGEQAGNYRGTEAFGGISPQKLGSMRADYLRAMEEGVEGRDWYDRASATNLKLTGGDTARADKLADIEAITSARTPVGANLMYSAKGTNQALVGDPVKTGGFPSDMGKQIEKTWADESSGKGLGLKRSPYRAGLAVDWMGPESVKRATHDIHDVRAWGITDPKTGGAWSKGVAPAGHRFLDEQADWARDTANARELGGFGDWNLHKAQAAAWIAQKAKRKGMSVEDAAKDYTDFVPDYSAQITREWTPGATSSHLPELLRGMDPAQLRQFSDAMEATVRGPQGIDKLASDMGMLSDTTLANRGLYEGNVTPGQASQVLVGKGSGGHDMDPASRKAAEAVAAAHGLLGHQDQVALNYLGGEAPMKSAGAYRIGTGRPMSERGLENVSRIAALHGGDVAQVDPRGARVLSFHDEGSPQRKALVEALRADYPHADVTSMARDSSLFPTKPGSDWEKLDSWSSKPFIEKVEAGGPNMVAGFDKSMKTIAPQQLAVVEQFAAQHGMTQAPYYRTMMEALSTGGLAALKDLVAKGVVPVAAFTAVVQTMQGEEQMQ